MDAMTKILLNQAVKTVTRILKSEGGKDLALDGLLDMAMGANPATIKIEQNAIPANLPACATVVTFKDKAGLDRTIVVF